MGYSDRFGRMSLKPSASPLQENLKTSDFEFDLPETLIAQAPLEDREAARMMVVNRNEGTLSHHTVRDLPLFLRPHDCMILNDTRVIPARIHGCKEKTGGKIELLLLEETSPGEWDVLCGASRRPKPGTHLVMAGGRIRAEVLEWRVGCGLRVRFQSDGPLIEVLEQVGLPPLPPYIRRPQAPPADVLERDRKYYQTVYARTPGAIAAPTAGLHLTTSLLEQVARQGVTQASVTLHVGLGTFKPVKAEAVNDHVMEAERYDVPACTVAAIVRAKTNGGRIIAVGSTSARTLETVCGPDGIPVAGSGRTRIFIYPPYRFKGVDAMLTNFHLPRSTLIMMVSALAGSDLIRRAYAEAVREKYRFYSYGDCMLII